MGWFRSADRAVHAQHRVGNLAGDEDGVGAVKHCQMGTLARDIGKYSQVRSCRVHDIQLPQHRRGECYYRVPQGVLTPRRFLAHESVLLERGQQPIA